MGTFRKDLIRRPSPAWVGAITGLLVLGVAVVVLVYMAMHAIGDPLGRN